MKKLLTMKRVSILILLLCLGVQSITAQSKKRVSILGDSYSTFEGYIPAENEPWYFQKIDTSRSDVVNVRLTWWWQLIKDGGYLLEKNESYSGATICYTGYNDEDYSPRSFITRLPRVGSPDILIIFGCTNDSWAGAKVGNYQYSDFKRGDLYFYRPALAKLLDEALSRYPNVDIYFVVNSELRRDIVESTLTICKHYDIPCIQLENVEKRWGHPTAKGMKSIADQLRKAIK
jgi:hypothetical protein